MAKASWQLRGLPVTCYGFWVWRLRVTDVAVTESTSRYFFLAKSLCLAHIRDGFTWRCDPYTGRASVRGPRSLTRIFPPLLARKLSGSSRILLVFFCQKMAINLKYYWGWGWGCSPLAPPPPRLVHVYTPMCDRDMSLRFNPLAAAARAMHFTFIA